MNQTQLLKDYEYKCRMLAEFKRHSLNNPIIERLEVDEILDKFKANAEAYRDKIKDPVKKMEADSRIEDIQKLYDYYVRILALEDIQAKFLQLTSKYIDISLDFVSLRERNDDLEKELIKYKRIHGDKEQETETSD